MSIQLVIKIVKDIQFFLMVCKSFLYMLVFYPFLPGKDKKIHDWRRKIKVGLH
jgi:hypothetical protein